MRQATDLRELARRRAALIQTAADANAERFNRPTVSPVSHSIETHETDTQAVIACEEFDLAVLGRTVLVSVRRDGGAITGVQMLTADDERRVLTDAVNRQLLAGRCLAVQAVRQLAMADLIRELRRVELAEQANGDG